MIENLESRLLLSASVANGILTVTGTDHADRINVVQRGAAVVVQEGSSVSRFGKKDHVRQIVINALGGNDRIKVTSKLGATIDSGDGKDLIIGGAGSDVLLGGNGDDRILGQAGNDSVSGGAGRDALFGGAGDDMIDAYDTQADQLTGGAGIDSARVDSQTDTSWNIENYLAVTTNSSGSVTDISNDSVINVNAGKLIIDTAANAATGSVIVAGSNLVLGGNTERSGTINGIADSVTALGNLTLSGNTILNISAITGFTVGTYRLITMTNFTSTGDIVIGTNYGPGAFNYSIVEVAPTDLNSTGHIDLIVTQTPAAPAADPVAIVAPESPAVDESPAQSVAEDSPAAPVE